MKTSSPTAHKLTIITSNIGSFFPYKEELVKLWMSHILSVVKDRNPELFVLHLQEFGHKRVLDRNECTKVIDLLKETFSNLFDSMIMISDLNADDKSRYTKFQYESDDTGSPAKNIKFNMDLFPQAPNEYSSYRNKQLSYILDWLQQNDCSNNIIAGDYNFRPHCYTLANALLSDEAVFDKLTDELDSKSVVIKYKDSIIIKCGVKIFSVKPNYAPNSSNVAAYMKGDVEYNNFQHPLQGFEYPIKFLPSYCMVSNGNTKIYSSSRCPSFCDRIILFGSDFIEHVKKNNPVETTNYNTISSQEFIGDHQRNKFGVAVKQSVLVDIRPLTKYLRQSFKMIDANIQAVIEQRIQLYYKSLCENRQAVAAEFYMNDAISNFQGTACTNIQAIHEKLTSMPFSNLQIVLSKVVCLPVGPNAFLVSVYGKLRDANDPVLEFTHSLVMPVVNGNTLKISHDIFQLVIHDN